MAWLSEYPQAVVKAYMRMLPMLRAQECLDGVGIARAASARKATPQLRTWQRRAKLPLGSGGLARKVSPAELSALGIGVRTVTKGGPA
jgi:hypothetical protein